MWKFLKYIPVFLKYVVKVGPLVHDVSQWGIKIVRGFRTKKKIKPPEEPPVGDPDLDPG